MASTAPTPVHIPAWKRLGLQLKNQQQSEEPSHYPEAFKSVEATPEKRLENHLVSGFTGSRLPEDGARDGNSPARPGKRKAKDAVLGDGENLSEKRPKERKSEHSSPQAGLSAVQEKKVPFSSTSSADQENKPRGDPNYRSRKARNNDTVPKKRRISSEGHVLEDVSSLDHRNLMSTSLDDIERISPSRNQDTLHQSTETEHNSHNVSRLSGDKKTPSKVGPKRTPDIERTSTELTPGLTRRKSVTFTPDTKTVDGNSASELFKAWAAQQKGPSADFTASEVAQFTPPPKLHPANDLPPSENFNKKDVKKAKKAKLAESSERVDSTTVSNQVDKNPANTPSEEVSKPSKAELKAAKKAKKATAASTESAAYLDYLTRYHTSRDTWKFNKATQSNILRDALNIFRIPAEYSPALKAYITGLQGAAARDRLREAATALLKDEGEGEKAEDMEILADREARKAAHDDALRKRLQLNKRLRDAGDQIPTAEREPKRKLMHQRAQDILEALMAGAPAPAPTPTPTPAIAPISPKPIPFISHVEAPNAVPKTIVSTGTGKRMVFEDDNLPAPPPKPRARNRKRRTDVSDDESSSSDDSSDSSDSDSESKKLLIDAGIDIDVDDDSSPDESSEEDKSDSDDEEEEDGEVEGKQQTQHEDETRYDYSTSPYHRRALAAPGAMKPDRSPLDPRLLITHARTFLTGLTKIKSDEEDEANHESKYDADVEYERRRSWAIQAAKDMERARKDPRSSANRFAKMRRRY